MAYQVLADDLTIVKQKHQVIYIRIEILNRSFKTIGSIDGELIDDSFTISAESDIRRTVSLTLIVKDKSFVISEKSKLWFDKYLKIWVGYKVQRDQSIRYYPMGLYTFSEANYQYDASTSTLSLSCLDLMAELNGTRNGQLSALVTSIPVDTDIREAIVSTVTQLGGIQRYRVHDIQKTVPYDLDISAGATVYDILTQLRDLYPNYEIFFDEDTFVYQPIPSGYTDALFLSSDIFTPLVISESTNYNLSEVKNCTEIWGRCIDSDYYSEEVACIDNQYTIKIQSFVPTDEGKIPSRTLIGFKASANNLSAPTIQIIKEVANGSNTTTEAYGPFPIVDFTHQQPLEADVLLADKAYVVRFQDNQFVLQGQYQIHAISKLLSFQPNEDYIVQDRLDNSCDNISYQVIPDSPYCIDKIGEIRNVLSGGEYDNIYTDELCIQRADYENWKTTRLTDTITIEMITIPWLDVNKKVEYTSLLTGETHQYLIKDISGSLIAGTSTVTMMRFYPLYNFET